MNRFCSEKLISTFSTSEIKKNYRDMTEANLNKSSRNKEIYARHRQICYICNSPEFIFSETNIKKEIYMKNFHVM